MKLSIDINWSDKGSIFSEMRKVTDQKISDEQTLEVLLKKIVSLGYLSDAKRFAKMLNRSLELNEIEMLLEASIFLGNFKRAESLLKYFPDQISRDRCILSIFVKYLEFSLDLKVLSKIYRLISLKSSGQRYLDLLSERYLSKRWKKEEFQEGATNPWKRGLIVFTLLGKEILPKHRVAFYFGHIIE